MVVSETNAAIDENLQKISERNKLQPKQVLRLGSVPTDIHGELKKYYAEEVTHQYFYEQSKKNNTKMADYWKQMQYAKKLVDGTKIILATVSTIGKAKYDHAKFKYVLIDEASILSDAAIISCLKSDTDRLLLIGDVYQRPPFQYVVFDCKHDFGYANVGEAARKHFFHRSALKRLTYFAANKQAVIQLKYQYRYHPYIMEIVQCFYDNFTLISGLPDDKFNYIQLEGMDYFHQTIEKERVNFIQCDLDDEDDGEDDDKCMINFSEIECCLELLLKMDLFLKNYGFNYSVLIYIPYKNQLHCLQQYLDDKFFKRRKSPMIITLQSLDSCQGITADIVIGVFVRRNRDKNIGFLRNTEDDFSRLLVGVSRARVHLFMVAHLPTFEEDPYWKRIIAKIKVDDSSDGHAIKHIKEFEYKKLYDYDVYEKTSLRKI